jgi:hypothetical protein
MKHQASEGSIMADDRQPKQPAKQSPKQEGEQRDPGRRNDMTDLSREAEQRPPMAKRPINPN